MKRGLAGGFRPLRWLDGPPIGYPPSPEMSLEALLGEQLEQQIRREIEPPKPVKPKKVKPKRKNRAKA